MNARTNTGSPLKHLAAAMTLLGGFALGCTLTLTELEPCPTGSNNKLTTDADGMEQCECLIGFDWCSDDTSDFDCCPIGDGDGCEPASPPPADDTCDETTEGFVFCSNTAEDGVCGSIYYICSGGAWVDATASLNDDCIAEGFDFAFGCFDDGVEVKYECGVGPGTACTLDTPDACDGDGDSLLSCESEKLTALSCLDFCQTTSDGGGPFEYGECATDEAGAGCLCCNSGDDGCPI